MDLGAIGGMITSLKAAKDIAQAMITLRDEAALQAKTLELQSKILDAQSSAFAANEERTALIERIRELEAKMTRLEAWDTEKQRYELKLVYPGAFAYALKNGSENGEPPHWLCTACYERGKKSLLQNDGRAKDDPRTSVYKCSDCKSQIRTHYDVKPGKERGQG